ALLHEHVALVQLAPHELGVPGEEAARQLTLERGLRRRDDGRRLDVAPGSVVSVRLAIPRLEVDGAALLRDSAFVAVDPVARERARTHELMLDAAARMERERQRRPRRGRLDAEQRPAPDAARRRKARTPADRLHEAGPVAGDLRVGAQDLERYP